MKDFKPEGEPIPMINNTLINLTSIRALYQEHLKDLEKVRNKEGSISKIYALHKAISQRRIECVKAGFNMAMLDMPEESFDSWLKGQLEKGVRP
jgi:hypothetical protein